MSIRNQRIAEQVRAELAKLLREEISDPRVGLLTLNRVKVSPDLSTALVFWSPLDVSGETDLDEMADGLDSAAGFLRGRLGQNLNLRRTPQVSFRFDPSIREGSEVLGMLRALPEVRDAALGDSAEGASAERASGHDGADDGNEGVGRHGEEA